MTALLSDPEALRAGVTAARPAAPPRLPGFVGLTLLAGIGLALGAVTGALIAVATGLVGLC